MTRDGRDRVRLGIPEWLAVLGILGGCAAWAQRTHSRLTAIETVMAAEVPRITRTLEVMTGKLDVVARLEQQLHDVDRRVERIENTKHE